MAKKIDLDKKKAKLTAVGINILPKWKKDEFSGQTVYCLELERFGHTATAHITLIELENLTLKKIEELSKQRKEKAIAELNEKIVHWLETYHPHLKKTGKPQIQKKPENSPDKKLERSKGSVTFNP